MVHFEYAVSPSPDGLALAFKVVGNDRACMVLGGSIFHGTGFTSLLKMAVEDTEVNKKSTVLCYWMNAPERYGVAENDKEGNCLSIEEKTGATEVELCRSWLVFPHTHKVVDVAKHIKPSARGELEITIENQELLKDGELKVHTWGRGFAWLYTGTHDSMTEASTF